MRVKLLNLRYLFLAIPLFAACAREDDACREDVREGTVYTFRAVVDGDVKTTIQEDGTVSWKAGDQIAIWDEKGGSFCTFESVEGDGYFSFVGEPGTDYSFTRAFYPASMAKGSNVITLPSEYSIEEAESGSFHPMAGVVGQKEETVTFRQLGAVLKMSVLGMPEGVQELVLSSAQTTLSGDFTLEGSGLDDGWVTGDGEDITSGGTIPVKAASQDEIHSGEGGGTVTVTLGTESRRNTVMYIPLPVGAYTCTLTVRQASGNESAFTTPNFKDIMRKKLVSASFVMNSFGGGSGTLSDPYVISTVEQLQDLSLFATEKAYGSASYVLSDDMDMAGVEFTPIGTALSSFSGTFDGHGHAIRNLTVSTEEYAGLFGYVSGTVKNLVIEGANVSTTAGNYAGAVAACAESGLIEGCRVDETSTVISAGIGAGSIAGLVKGATINACSSHANVQAVQYAGGIAGFLNPLNEGDHALVINCSYEPVYVDGKMAKAQISTTHKNTFMGGVVGAATVAGEISDADAKIVNCYGYPLELSSSQTESTTIYHAGGILGFASGNVTVNNCLSPVTYSNVLRNGIRLNARNYTDLNSAASIVGRVYTDGVTITRAYSKYTWDRTYGVYGDISITLSDNNQELGDTNLRGIGTDMVGILNSGAAQWNATGAVKALNWEYGSTFGYPKPAGVDAQGSQLKKVSLMGDSITTFKGYMFSDKDYKMNHWYPQASTTSSPILNEQETWWWKLIYDKMTDARLEASNTFSGTTVTYTKEKLDGMSRDVDSRINSNSFQGRAHYGFGDPDVLIFYGGRNDYGLFGGNSDSLLGSYTAEALQAAYDTASGEFFANYSQGFVAVLRDFHAAHPEARILVLVCDQVNDGYANAALAVTDFLAGKGLDIRCINFHEMGTNNATNTAIGINKEDGPHPNTVGASNMADYIWNQVGEWLDN